VTLDGLQQLAEDVDTNSDETDSVLLARLVLLVMPVVRAAEALRDVDFTKQSNANSETHVLSQAVNTMRAALEKM
jgi:hypothetical protein